MKWIGKTFNFLFWIDFGFNKKKKLRERETQVERNIEKYFVVNPAFSTAKGIN